MITSFQNERVKRVSRLRKGRYRRKSGLFVIDGARELSRAVSAGVEITELFHTAAKTNATDVEQEVLSAASVAAEVVEVTPAIMRKLCFGDRDEGFVAVARMPQRRLSELQLPDNPLLSIIEGIEKPGNLGAILRTADGAGFHGVIVIDGGTDLYNPNLIRASLGTVFSLQVCKADREELHSWLSERQFQIVTTIVETRQAYTEVDYRQSTAVVLGSEHAGLSDAWRDPSDAKGKSGQVWPVRIPMLGVADSLNVSAAAAVLFYEARRQRDFAQQQNTAE
ncbi:MAG: RNA methyltransferase [Pirellulales bacterium]|nr:RNA methyltransferase [Pirellulales bacterium]